MFRVIHSQNSHGQEIIMVRLARENQNGYLGRWKRTSHSWKGMLSHVLTHRHHLLNFFGEDVMAILLTSVLSEVSGDWEPHLNRVALGVQKRMDRECVNTITFDTMRGMSVSEAQILAELRQRLNLNQLVVTNFPSWLGKTSGMVGYSS